MSIRWVKMKIYAAVNMCVRSHFPKMVRLTYIPRRKCIPNESEYGDNEVRLVACGKVTRGKELHHAGLLLNKVKTEMVVTTITTIVEVRSVTRGKVTRGEELHHAGLLPIINSFVTR